MRFWFYINEFKLSSDSDYPAPDDRRVVIWDKNDKYTLTGKTHGLLSHGIKHLSEFKPTEFKTVVSKAKLFINKTNFLILKNNSVDQSNSLTDSMVINTFDRINDKIMAKEPLTKEENSINIEYLEKIKSMYSDVLQTIANDSVNVDRLSLDKIKELIKSGKTLRATGKKILFFNFKKGIFGLKYPKKGWATIFSNKSTTADYIIKNIKDNEPLNKELLKL